MSMLLIILCSLIVLFISVYVYKLSYGLFTFSSWVYTQSILLPFVGSVLISIINKNNFFIYIFWGIVFYFIGFLIAYKKSKKSKQSLVYKETNFYNPVNKKILNMAIFLSFVISICLLINYIETFGTLYKNKNLLETMLSVSGYNRLLFTLYSNTAFEMYALLGLVLFKIYKHRIYLILSLVSIVITMFEGIVFGSKVGAIVPLLYFIVCWFYIDKKIQWRYFIFFIPLSILLTILIVKHIYLDNDSNDVLSLLFLRATTVSIIPVYEIIYKYVPTYGLLYGKSFLWEIIRIINQVLQDYNRPLLNEVINDMINGLPIDTVSRISAATKVFGVGYANFGLFGGLFFSFVLGYFVQYLNLKLLSFEKVNIFLFMILIEFYFIFLMGLAESGMILISLESFILSTTPLLLLWSLFYLILALPLGKSKFRIIRTYRVKNAVI